MLSLKEVLSWIKKRRNRKCIFESDTKSLLVMQSKKFVANLSLVQSSGMSELLKNSGEVLVIFVHRNANSVVHLLVQTPYSTSDL